MLRYIEKFRDLSQSVISKLILTVGLTLLVSVAGWSYFNIQYQRRNVMANLSAEADRLSTTIKLGTHYAMMLNSRDDIAQIITNISRQREIKNIRIYNKEGQITYSNQPAEVGRVTRIKDEACFVCHRSEPPQTRLELSERTRVFQSSQGYRLMGILSPIYNEPGCSSSDCHMHPEGKQVLGALDVVFSLEAADLEMSHYKRTIMALTLIVLVLTSMAILVFVIRFIRRPINRIIEGTRVIARGEHLDGINVHQGDELGQLAGAVTKMGLEIEKNQVELNRQRDEYQRLFEVVPCLITVLDRDYRLINYNREFAEKFDPAPGDFCYKAFKGRDEKCVVCPVERTFEDGQSHQSEEKGLNRDGTEAHWIAVTSPVTNARGEMVAAMEVCLDITPRKKLENELERSEAKYHDIFNNIPNPVFVLDLEILEILNCNHSVETVYGYSQDDLIGRSFSELFPEEDREHYTFKMRTAAFINQAVHISRTGKRLSVNIRISPSEFQEQSVLLVTTSDVTKRLEVEQQLQHASKMATLGEMATGVAHELNQPLSVIKTVSSFFCKKIERRESLDEDTLFTMLSKVDSNVDRATKIISHMRMFARKSGVKLVPVQVNDVLERAFDIFRQQLKARGIEVVWDVEAGLPEIMADPDRLEQVLINLVINARDAIEEERRGRDAAKGDKQIVLRTRSAGERVVLEVSDNGPGIPAELLDKVFDPFFTTKEVGKGTGLGLSISYGIVKDCGGDIRVTSANGGGARFIIEFPIRDRYDERQDTAG